MVRRFMPIAVLVAILGIAWILLRRDDDAPDDAAPHAWKIAPPIAAPPASIDAPGASEATRLQGRPDRRPAVVQGPSRFGRSSRTSTPTTGRIRYEGTVRGEDGRVLPGAEVYQALRSGSLESRWRRPRHATTDEEGRFVLHARPDLDDVFGAQAHGHTTIFVDGAAARATHEIHFVLPEMPQLIVRIVDPDGEPVAWGGIRVVPTERRGKHISMPGPDWPRPEQVETTDAEGVAVFGYDVPTPVMVIPDVEGLVTSPLEQWLPQAAGTVTFTATRGTTLILDVVNEKGTAVDGSVWAEIHDAVTSDVVLVVRGSPMASILEEDLALPPGTYAVEISAPGYEPHVLPGLAFPGGGAEVKRSVVMRPLAEGAMLTLHPPESWLKRESLQSSVTLLMRRTDEGWSSMGWRAHTEVRLDSEAGFITAGFRPGTYDLILAIDGGVAPVGPITFVAGQAVTRRAHPRAGVRFSLYEVLPPDMRVRRLRIELPGLGYMPSVGRTLRGSGSLLDSLAEAGSAARRNSELGAVLGPYPGSHVVLEVTDWRGTVHRFTATR